MLGQSIRWSFQRADIPIQMLLGFVIGLLSAIASLWISPLFVLVILAGILCLYAMLKKPELGLLGILIATSSIVFEEELPLFSLGSVSLHISDILLLGLLGIIAGRWLVRTKFKIIRTPLDTPLLIFYGVTILSTFIALNNSSVDAETARRGIRVLSYYLTFFVVTNLIRNRRQINLLLNSIFILASIVAAFMIAQFLLGSSVHLLPGYVGELMTQGALFGDVERIVPPGHSIVLISFVTILCSLVMGKGKSISWRKILQGILMGSAIIVTFLRSYWAALIGVFIIMVCLSNRADRQRLFRRSMVAIASAAMIYLVVLSGSSSKATQTIDATLNRLSTLGRIGTFQQEDSSLNWRKIENSYAISTIASNPLIGLGIGFTYRPWDPRLDHRATGRTGDDFRKFIHNGHLLILLRSGILGYLSLLWLSFAFLFRGFRYWRSVNNDKMRLVMLGFTLVYLAVLIAAVVNSTFQQWFWTPVIGIIMGVNEVILRLYRREEQVE
jgi:O-antigen ligase